MSEMNVIGGHEWWGSKQSYCKWKEETSVFTDGDGDYATGCDNMFTIMEGNPKDNGFKYCPYCGGEIISASP